MDAADKEKIRKLADILMPYAAQQREVLRANPRLAYYTSADVAEKIIRKQELWFRDSDRMNDSMEVRHGTELLNDYFSDETKRAAFCAAVNAIQPGAADEALAKF